MNGDFVEWFKSKGLFFVAFFLLGFVIIKYFFGAIKPVIAGLFSSSGNNVIDETNKAVVEQLNYYILRDNGWSWIFWDFDTEIVNLVLALSHPYNVSLEYFSRYGVSLKEELKRVLSSKNFNIISAKVALMA